MIDKNPSCAPRTCVIYLPSGLRRNLWDALLEYCFGHTSTERRCLYGTSMCGILAVYWTARAEHLVFSSLIGAFHILIISLAEDSYVCTFLKPPVCHAAVQFLLYFYFFWKKTLKISTIWTQPHNNLEHFASIRLIVLHFWWHCPFNETDMELSFCS
jgi:hypothetical protein